MTSSTAPPPQESRADTAFILELVIGLFGYLGVGYLYLGRTSDGLIRLIGWLVYLVVSWSIIVCLSFVVVGLFLIPFNIVLQVVIPVLSALQLKRELKNQQLLLESGAPASDSRPQPGAATPGRDVVGDQA